MNIRIEDDYTSYSYRTWHHFYFVFLLAHMAIFTVLFTVLAVYTQFYFILIFAPLNIFVMGLNVKVVRNRLRYYLHSFSVTPQELKIIYFDKDEQMTKNILWQNINFHFGYIKSDSFLDLWDKDVKLFTIYKSIAKQKNKFLDIKKELLKYVPQDKIIKNKSFFTNEVIYTKNTDFIFFK